MSLPFSKVVNPGNWPLSEYLSAEICHSVLESRIVVWGVDLEANHRNANYGVIIAICSPDMSTQEYRYIACRRFPSVCPGMLWFCGKDGMC